MDLYEAIFAGTLFGRIPVQRVQKNIHQLPDDVANISGSLPNDPDQLSGTLLPVQHNARQTLYLHRQLFQTDIFVLETRHEQTDDRQQVDWEYLFAPQVENLLSLIKNLPIGIIRVNRHWRAEFVNGYACTMFGASESELMDNGWISMFETAELKSLLERLRPQTGAVISDSYRIPVITPLGRRRVLHLAAVKTTSGTDHHGGYTLVLFDVTREEEANDKIRFVAEHDALTQMLNRSAFVDALQALDTRSLAQGVMLFIDVNHFKEINDLHGHATGDKLLQIVAQRLQNAVRSNDLIARFGGDEFVLFARDMDSHNDLLKFANHIASRLSDTIQMKDDAIPLSASVGVASVESLKLPIKQDNQTEIIDALIQAADSAMYQAKRDPSSQLCFFDEALRGSQIQWRARMAEQERISREVQTEFVYQPIFRGDTPVAVEILARPAGLRYNQDIDAFIECVRRHDSSYQRTIFDVLTERSLQDFARWADRYPLQLNLNIDLVQLTDNLFSQRLSHWVTQLGLAPERLCLEITETCLEADGAVLNQLGRLQHIGFRIAIDDYGTGYSSLKRLMSFPFDQLKIDRYFTDSLADSQRHATALRSLATLGRSLGMETLVEGVETQHQWLALSETGIDLMQGFYLAAPMPLETLHPLLETRLQGSTK